MKGELYINGKDAWEEWGASMGEGFLSALDAPAEPKARVEAESRLESGKRVVVSSSTAWAAREAALEFVLCADDEASLERARRSFLAEVCPMPLTLRVPRLGGQRYALVYKGRGAEYGHDLARHVCRVALKFEEPDPSDRGRSIEASHAAAFRMGDGSWMPRRMSAALVSHGCCSWEQAGWPSLWVDGVEEFTGGWADMSRLKGRSVSSLEWRCTDADGTGHSLAVAVSEMQGVLPPPGTDDPQAVAVGHMLVPEPSSVDVTAGSTGSATVAPPTVSCTARRRVGDGEWEDWDGGTLWLDLSCSLGSAAIPHPTPIAARDISAYAKGLTAMRWRLTGLGGVTLATAPVAVATLNLSGAGTGDAGRFTGNITVTLAQGADRPRRVPSPGELA